jgi:hypothetical protein
MNRINRRDFGKLVSAAAAGLVGGAVLAGCGESSPPAPPPVAKPDAPADKHACKGMNACKGKGGCKTGDNGCAGKNSCKGKGGCKVPVESMK